MALGDIDPQDTYNTVYDNFHQAGAGIMQAAQDNVWTVPTGPQPGTNLTYPHNLTYPQYTQTVTYPGDHAGSPIHRCSPNDHRFACRHESLCECGRTQRLMDLSLTEGL